jgi:hypothetical protein
MRHRWRQRAWLEGRQRNGGRKGCRRRLTFSRRGRYCPGDNQRSQADDRRRRNHLTGKRDGRRFGGDARIGREGKRDKPNTITGDGRHDEHDERGAQARAGCL